MKKMSSLLISTFSPWKDNQRIATNGMIEPLLYYFLPRFKTISLLDQPYPGSDRITPVREDYKNGKLKRKKKINVSSGVLYPFLSLVNKPGTHVIYKIRDILSTIEAGTRSSENYDMFVGLESINAIGGIILRKLGKVKTVCYYCSDYSPQRFSSPYLNNLYLWLDRFAAAHCDYIWDVSLAMQPARIKAGLNPQKSAPVIYVPNALFKEQIDSLPLSNRDSQSIVFMGTLGLENGPDLAIESFQIVLKKYPKAILHIIGGGGKGFEAEYLNNLARKLKVEKNVVFHGFISDVKKVSEVIKHFQIALAPYKMIKGSIRLYGDATKIRQYLAAGLPIITTEVPPLGKVAQKAGAALIVKDTKEDIAKAIISLLNNKKEMVSMISKAETYAKNNTWENTYGKAIQTMENN